MKPAAATLCTLLVLAGCSAPSGYPDGLGGQPPGPQPSTRTGVPGAPTGPGADRPPRPLVVGTVATDLEAPWGIAFLPDGTA
ncbi:MAG: PQQ-dependent sugar dehydrogenase, partial [Nocardioidaceae bacterium]